MSSLFDPATRAEGGPITEIDGLPYILDVHLHAFVPYDRPAGIRWAATNYIEGSPEGPVLWHKARLPGSARTTTYAALTEPQALFIATRAGLAFDKITARAQIAAAFADWARRHESAALPAGVLPDGYTDPVAMPTPAEPAAPVGINVDFAHIQSVIHAIGVVSGRRERMLRERQVLDGGIADAERRLAELANKLPPYLRIAQSA
jgi:hypothetical protein